MLTRRQALQAILAAPAFRLLPAAAAPLVYSLTWSNAPTISLPHLRPGEKLVLTMRWEDGTTQTVTREGGKQC